MSLSQLCHTVAVSQIDDKFITRDSILKTLSMIYVGTPESIDASCCPLPQPVKSWVWLVHLERVCALLIGRCLGGMLVGSPMSSGERETSSWLVSSLFVGGLHKSSSDLGNFNENLFFRNTLDICCKTSKKFIIKFAPM